MLAIDETGQLRALPRRSHREAKLIAEGWRFLPLNRHWDADEREWVARAVGLHDLDSDLANHACDSWWKCCAKAYLRTRDSIEAAAEAWASASTKSI